MKDSKNTSVAEKMMLSLCIMSIVSIITAITFGILYLIFEKEYMDTIAGYGLTIFILPALILQVMVSADSSYIGSEIKQKYWLYPIFFLIVFPFSIMWFFAGIDSLFHFTPDFHNSLLKGEALQELRQEDMMQSWRYVGMIYFCLITLGLIIRLIKNLFGKPKPTMIFV